MAAPNPPVLDPFAGAGQSVPPNANWAALSGVAMQLRLFNNAVGSQTDPSAGFDFYQAAAFGPDYELSVTANALPGANTRRIFLGAVSVPSGTLATNANRNGYQLTWTLQAAADAWQLLRVDLGAGTSIGNATQDITPGDAICLQRVFPDVLMWRWDHTIPGWALVGRL